MFCALAVLLCVSPAERNSQHAELQDIIDGVLRGDANFGALLARARSLGQEAALAADLSTKASRVTDPARVRNVAQALAALGQPNGEPGLLHLLGSTDGATRMFAAQGAGRLKSQAAGSTLTLMLKAK